MLLKKIFATSLIFLIFIGVFYGIYLVVFNKDSDSVKENITNNSIDQDSSSSLNEDKKIRNLTGESIFSANINKEDGLIYFYNKLDGDLWTITDRGTNMQKVVTKNFKDIKSVKWSSDGKSEIINFVNGKIVIFNHKTNQEINLKNGVDLADWSNISDKILYKFYDNNKKERSLNISDLNGENWKKIATLPFRYTSFQNIPSSIQVAFWQSADAYISSELFKANITSLSDPVKVLDGRYGADFLFSQDGSKFLVSFVTEQGGSKMSLAVVDSQGSNFKDLKIPTFVQKIVWSKDGKNIYYAQPTEIPNGSVMPNDYLENKFTTQDTFWKLDVTTGKKERIVELKDLTEQIDATNLFLSRTEDALFFINKKNGLLYKLSIN